MKNLSSSFFIVLLITAGYLFFGSWYWPCKVKGLCGNDAKASTQNTPAVTPQVTPEPSAFSLPFRLMDNGKVVVEDPAGVNFGKNSETPVFGSGISAKLKDIATMFQDNADQDLVITGLYSPDDQLPEGSTQTNLGLARANQFKNMLASMGIPSKRMISLYERSSHPRLYGAGDSLMGGIKLDLIDREIGDDGPKNPMAEPFYVHFETGSSYVKLDSTLRSNITHTIQYLNGVEGAQLLLIGHTDNVGNPDSNLSLGLNRANDLAKIFIEFGLSADQVSTSSSGQNSPIASNETEEGRAENRRVEMRIPNEN